MCRLTYWIGGTRLPLHRQVIFYSLQDTQTINYPVGDTCLVGGMGGYMMDNGNDRGNTSNLHVLDLWNHIFLQSQKI